MAPPSLTFSRFVRQTSEATFTIVPSCDPQRREVVTRRARLVLLTDLLMFCEVMPDEDRLSASQPGAEMWLMYPPLAGKHLRVDKALDPLAFEVTVMKREKVVVKVATRESRDAWVRSLEDAIDFGSARASLRLLRGGTDLTRCTHTEPSRLKPDDRERPPISPAESSRSYGSGNAHGTARSPPLPPQPLPPTQPLRIQGRGRSRSPPSDGYIRPGHGPPPPPPPGSRGHGMVRRSSTSDRWDDRDRRGPSRSDGGHSPRLAGESRRLRVRQSETDRLLGSGPPPDDYYSRGMRNGQLSPAPGHPMLRKSPSAHALGHSSHGSYDPRLAGPPPPLPGMDTWRSTDARGAPYSDGYLTPGGSREGHGSGQAIYRSRSTEPFRDRHYQKPSISLQNIDHRPRRFDEPDDLDSPPHSPVDKGPKTSVLAASMKTKVFLKQTHSQWKSLGVAKLKVFVLSPGNQKQLVVEGDKGKVMISTIVLSDGVERVGRTGVAVDLSDKGAPTGIVYMLQVRHPPVPAGLHVLTVRSCR